MNRITKAYRTQFAWMLRNAGIRRADEGSLRFIERARRRAHEKKQPVAASLADLYEELSSRRLFRPTFASNMPDRFFCDSGLGGLARWLRAAGYEAEWDPCIDDAKLLRIVRQEPAVLLTTDSMLMERKLLRDKIIPAFWLPPIHSSTRQLGLVVREFHMKLRPSRCMRCGGALKKVSKEEMKERIPPRTYRWIDDYFQCERCGQLFWHGTHWFRIRGELERVWERCD